MLTAKDRTPKKTDTQEYIETINVPDDGHEFLYWALTTVAIASTLAADIKCYTRENEGETRETCKPKLIKRHRVARRILKLLSIIEEAATLICEDERVFSPIDAVLKESCRIRKENLKKPKAEKEAKQ